MKLKAAIRCRRGARAERGGVLPYRRWHHRCRGSVRRRGRSAFRGAGFGLPALRPHADARVGHVSGRCAILDADGSRAPPNDREHGGLARCELRALGPCRSRVRDPRAVLAARAVAVPDSVRARERPCPPISFMLPRLRSGCGRGTRFRRRCRCLASARGASCSPLRASQWLRSCAQRQFLRVRGGAAWLFGFGEGVPSLANLFLLFAVVTALGVLVAWAAVRQY